MTNNYDNLKLEKGMYDEAGLSFTQVLEAMDPSENYRGTTLEGLDAYQRQLKRFDIRVKGSRSDVVEKFFRTTESAVLFPEFVARVVRQGMREDDMLASIAATVTQISGADYRSITSSSEDEKNPQQTQISRTTMQAQSSSTVLHKRGRMLVTTYEDIRLQRLDLFSVTLRQIGSQIARQHLEDAIHVLIDGDGNNNPAEKYMVGKYPINGERGFLSYEELLNFWGQFDPYTMNTVLVPTTVMLDIMKMPEVQSLLTITNFQKARTLIPLLGSTLLRASAMPNGKLIGLDRNYALEMVHAGDVIVETDKLIDRQIERSTITSVAGFAKLYAEASKVLSIWW